MFMEEKILSVIENTIKDLGFEIVKLIFVGLGDTKKLEILIDRTDSKNISIGDCRTVSKHVSVLLDVEDIIPDKYFLEVRSAGMERPLTKQADYQKFLNREVKILLHAPVNDTKKLQGVIVAVINDLITLKLESKLDSETIELKFSDIKKANLVVTDEMFRNILNKKIIV